MNWRLAFIIWAKGVGIFALPCILVIMIGWMFFLISFVGSWISIPIYAFTLWGVKRLNLSWLLSMLVILLLAPAASASAALYIIKAANLEMFSGYNDITFWVPAFCCALAVFFSRNSIRLYLKPEYEIEEYVTE